MLTRVQAEQARRWAVTMLRESGIMLAPNEEAAVEIADFGLGELESPGAATCDLRQQRPLLREGTRSLPASDVSPALPPFGRRSARKARDLPMPPWFRVPLRRRRCNARSEVHTAEREREGLYGSPRNSPGSWRAVHDSAKHMALVSGGRRGRRGIGILLYQYRQRRYLC